MGRREKKYILREVSSLIFVAVVVVLVVVEVVEVVVVAVVTTVYSMTFINT